MSGSGPAGRLRHRVTLERLTPSTQDSGGGVISTWLVNTTFWAAIDALPVSSRNYADKATAPVRYAIAIRPNRDVTVGDRLCWGERYLAIVAVQPHVLGDSLQQIEAIEERYA